MISGRGKIFTAGLDLTDAASTFVGDDPSKDVARKAFDHRRLIKDYQETFTCIEKVLAKIYAIVNFLYPLKLSVPSRPSWLFMVHVWAEGWTSLLHVISGCALLMLGSR